MSSAVAGAVVDVVMPRLSDSMEEGTIVAWTAADGAVVTRGEEIVEVETDKATMPYEAEASGVLHVLLEVGATAPVGAVIARIAPEGVEVAGGSAPAAPASEAPTSAAAPGASTTRVNASPLARRIAGELGIDLAALVGSGPRGRVVRADVLAASPPSHPSAPAPEPAAAASPTPAAPAAPAVPQAAAAVSSPPPAPVPAGGRGEATAVPLSRLQQVVARRMAESKATAPDFIVEAEIDMGRAVALRAQLKQLLAGDPPPSLNDFVVKACALALREHPRVNAAYRGDRFELHGRVNVGVAVASEDALLVPTVFDADRSSLGTIATATRRLAAAARDGSLTPPDLSGATFSISNLGMFGVDRFTAVLNPPQAAILAVGAVRERAVVRDGALAVAQTMNVALTCDHRILYGADGAAFLGRVRALLEQPELLLLG